MMADSCSNLYDFVSSDSDTSYSLPTQLTPDFVSGMNRSRLSLLDFIEKCRYYLRRREFQSLVGLLLSGKCEDTKVALDLTEFRPLTGSLLDFCQQRYYDRAIGIVQHVKLAKPLQLWHLPRKHDQLTEDVGLTHPITIGSCTHEVWNCIYISHYFGSYIVLFRLACI